ncbi:MAG TPA: hypothetical protein VE521_06650 [Nitrososphaera sp.]|jgi:hypothetical protein|nr:hypothetical protein [Nitrososphaera sp.]
MAAITAAMTMIIARSKITIAGSASLMLRNGNSLSGKVVVVVVVALPDIAGAAVRAMKRSSNEFLYNMLR